MGVPNFPPYIWIDQNKEARHYAVVDRSGWLLEAIEERASMPDLEKVFTSALKSYREGGKEFEEMPDALRTTASRLDEVLKNL